MDRLARRLDRIEKALGPDAGTCLRWPNPDGTFIKVPGCRTLVDLMAKYETFRGRHDADGIRQNRTD